jgi:hypothetical protein
MPIDQETWILSRALRPGLSIGAVWIRLHTTEKRWTLTPFNARIRDLSQG